METSGNNNQNLNSVPPVIGTPMSSGAIQTAQPVAQAPTAPTTPPSTIGPIAGPVISLSDNPTVDASEPTASQP